jgi:hypothetical protein
VGYPGVYYVYVIVCLVLGWNFLCGEYCGVKLVYVIVCFVVEWNLLCGILWGVVCICNCVFGCMVKFVVWDIVGCSLYM